jgi:hypothetical protein
VISGPVGMVQANRTKPLTAQLSFDVDSRRDDGQSPVDRTFSVWIGMDMGCVWRFFEDDPRPWGR